MLGLNPVTGAPLWKTAVGIHRNGDLPRLTGPTTILPGTYGGVLDAARFADGVVYAAALNAPSTLDPDQTAYFGGEIGTMDGDVVAMSAAQAGSPGTRRSPAIPRVGSRSSTTSCSRRHIKETVFALNRVTGAVVWSYDGPGHVNGWMSVVGDRIYLPVGSPAQLLALSLAPAP